MDKFRRKLLGFALPSVLLAKVLPAQASPSQKIEFKEEGNKMGTHLFIVYGQSNAKGTAQGTPGAPSFTSPLARYFNGTSLVPMTNNMVTSNDGVSSGSAWLSFSNRYAELTGNEIVFINSGKDSQSISQLQKGDSSNNYSKMLSFVNSAKSALAEEGKNIDEISVLFIQGERDQVLSTTKKSYKSLLNALWSNIKTDTKAARFFNYTVGTYNSSANQLQSWTIQEAQREACNESGDMFIASEVIPKIKTRGMNADTVHLSQLGYNTLGYESAEKVSEIINGGMGANSEQLSRQGTISMSPQHEWKIHGAWFNKVDGEWNLRADQSRGVSFVSSITDTNENYLTVRIPSDLSHIISAEGSSFYIPGMPDVKIRFGWLLYEERDSGGASLAKLYFTSDVQLNIDLINKTTSNNSNLSLPGVMINSYETGRITMNHPPSDPVPMCQLTGSVPHFISVASGSTVTKAVIESRNLSSALSNSTFSCVLKNMVIPPRALPNGIEVFFSILGAKKVML